jgi:hypothetical protein
MPYTHIILYVYTCVDGRVSMVQVKVKVENTDIDGDVHTILLDPMDFLRGFSVLKVTTCLRLHYHHVKFYSEA